MEEGKTLAPLHVSCVEQPLATINRAYTLLNASAMLALIYYRASCLTTENMGIKTLPLTLTFASELLLAFIWLLSQSSRWNPLVRTVFPDRLSQRFTDEQLPAIDVFICTADPEKEPPMQVMNTLVSAMSLDYPAEKLSVYLSDDAGSPLTRYALVQTCAFARSWLPFCKKYEIQTRCPESYFSAPCEGKSAEFLEEQEKIKLLYEIYRESVERGGETGEFPGCDSSEKKGRSYPAMIEVIHDGEFDLANDDQHTKILRLVYISREKRQGHPHHFKAGALNVLLRVSSIMSNAPFILVLDCDMHCNDPSSARQALCFLLDTRVSHSLAFVQFPQAFHNTSKNDIYDGQLTLLFQTMCKGLDGLKGPLLSGTGFYIKRPALYGTRPGSSSSSDPKSSDPLQSRSCFGSSNELLASICGNDDARQKTPSNILLQEAFLLATCTYEEDTEWGTEVGFLYHTVVEDFFTGFILHCRGWTSIFCSPSRPAFLGSAPIVLNDTLAQNKRWQSGLLAVGLSKFCPLIYGFRKTSIFQCMCYGFCGLKAISALPMLCLASIPQLCLLNNISLYPKVSDPCFVIFTILFLSSYSQNLMEVVWSGGSMKRWWNEQRMWMIRGVSSVFFAFLGVMMKLIGMGEIGFELTSKAVDDEKIRRYEKEEFDFEGLSLVFVPVMALAIINIATFIAGLWRVVFEKGFDRMFAQVFLSFFISASSYPLYKGMVVRKDKGCVPPFIIVLSLIISMIFLYLGSMVLVP